MTEVTDNVEFETGDPFNYRWTEEAFDEIKAGTLHRRLIIREGTVLAARIEGDCPRCGHRISFSLSLAGVISEGGILGRETVMPEVTYRVDVPCRCDHVHPKAPDHVTGCGIWFRVELKAGRDG